MKLQQKDFPANFRIWNVDQRFLQLSIRDLMETPKKVVEADRCFICSTVVAKKEKLYIFGKSSIDFCEIIKSALNVNVRNFSASEQLFICRAQCYQRLTKFKPALDNFEKAKSELEEVYKATVHRTKRLCKDDDDAEGDVPKEVDEHVEQSTRGKVAKALRFPEATTCTSSPWASPVALSEGQPAFWMSHFAASYR